MRLSGLNVVSLISLLGITRPACAFYIPTPRASSISTLGKGSLSYCDDKKQQPFTRLHVFNKRVVVPEPEPVVIQGVGEEGCNLPSLSGINDLPLSIQALTFISIFAVLGLSSVQLSHLLDTLLLHYEWVQTWRYTWPLLGAIYAAAGVTHFTLKDEYENIYPTRGSWGLWYLPGSREFHVRWTGVAEIVGGLGLLLGGLLDALIRDLSYSSPNIVTHAGIGSDSAAALLLLTVAMTPANIFMFTHGARLPIDGPEVPVVGHAIRGVMQVALFSLLYQMGEGTFDELLSS